MNEALAETDLNQDATLYRHTMKDEWGLAVLVWERGQKRGYRFEDGELRIFKKGYFDYLEEADASLARRERLLAAAAVADTSVLPAQNDARSAAKAIPLEKQIAYFGQLYPGGFAGDKWKKERRSDEGRTLKRHRDPALAKAAEMLAKDAIDQAIEAGDCAGVLERVGKALAATDLVTAAKRKKLASIKGEQAEGVAKALRAVLYGEGPLAIRFDAWVGRVATAIGTAPGWQMATAPLALVYPTEHVCVRPSSFRAQAAWMSPGLKLGRTPKAVVYERCVNMAKRVAEKLREADLAPTDMLDIYDFIWVTLKPKARETIRDM